MATDRVNHTRGNRSVVKRALPFLAVVLALLPVALYAWLGQYTRPIIDDYYTLRIGRELGAWNGMLFHLNVWSGSYTNFYLKSAMARLDAFAPPVTTWLLVACWLMAAIWLTRAVSRLYFKRPGWKLIVVIAASIVSASIHAQYSRQSFYWHAASLPYSLPIAIQTMYFALLAGSPYRSATGKGIALRAMAGALLCFLSAGTGEISVVFQATLLSLCLLIALALSRGQTRRNIMLLLGSGWLVTIISLLIQINTPGVGIRLQSQGEWFGLVIHDGRELAVAILDFTFRNIGHQRTFAGFALLYCVSFSATLFHFQPRPASAPDTEFRLNRFLLWLGLLSQLLLLPLLWMHRSDVPQVLGRFSPAYTAVIITNFLSMLVCAAALFLRRRISAALARNSCHARYVLCAAISAALMLFMMTQLRSIHWRAASYFYLSTLLILMLFAGQLSSWLGDRQLYRYFLLAVMVTLVAWVLFGAVLFTAFRALGYVSLRVLAQPAGAMALLGLVWGVCLGCLIKQWIHEWGVSQQGISWLGLCGAIVALMIGASIVSSQIRLIPDFARFAREWDDRHLSILDQRDQGVRDVKVRPLSFDMQRFLGLPSDPASRFRYALGYYDVDSIVEVASLAAAPRD